MDKEEDILQSDLNIKNYVDNNYYRYGRKKKSIYKQGFYDGISYIKSIIAKDFLEIHDKLLKDKDI